MVDAINPLIPSSLTHKHVNNKALMSKAYGPGFCSVFIEDVVCFASALCGGDHSVDTGFVVALAGCAVFVFPFELHHSRHICQFQRSATEIQFRAQ